MDETSVKEAVNEGKLDRGLIDVMILERRKQKKANMSDAE